MPAVATVLASAANYMICDDHEFVDNLGEQAYLLAYCICLTAMHRLQSLLARRRLPPSPGTGSSVKPFSCRRSSGKFRVLMRNIRVLCRYAHRVLAAAVLSLLLFFLCRRFEVLQAFVFGAVSGQGWVKQMPALDRSLVDAMIHQNFGDS